MSPSQTPPSSRFKEFPVTIYGDVATGRYRSRAAGVLVDGGVLGAVVASAVASSVAPAPARAPGDAAQAIAAAMNGNLNWARAIGDRSTAVSGAGGSLQSARAFGYETAATATGGTAQSATAPSPRPVTAT